MLDRLAWTGHCGFLYRGESKTLYIDPFRLPADLDEPADLILVTHCHFDHCSPADVERIVTPETVILSPADCCTALQELPGERKIVEAGTRIELMGLRIEGIPAYTRRSRLHGREHGWVGYLIEEDGMSWYHAGDTDFIREMKEIEADVACLPVSGGTVMTAVEAAAAAKAIDPGVAVPMHFGSICGAVKDAELFRSLASVEVRIPEPPREPEPEDE